MKKNTENFFLGLVVPFAVALATFVSFVTVLAIAEQGIRDGMSDSVLATAEELAVCSTEMTSQNYTTAQQMTILTVISHRIDANDFHATQTFAGLPLRTWLTLALVAVAAPQGIIMIGFLAATASAAWKKYHSAGKYTISETTAPFLVGFGTICGIAAVTLSLFPFVWALGSDVDFVDVQCNGKSIVSPDFEDSPAHKITQHGILIAAMYIAATVVWFVYFHFVADTNGCIMNLGREEEDEAKEEEEEEEEERRASRRPAAAQKIKKDLLSPCRNQHHYSSAVASLLATSSSHVYDPL